MCIPQTFMLVELGDERDGMELRDNKMETEENKIIWHCEPLASASESVSRLSR